MPVKIDIVWMDKKPPEKPTESYDWHFPGGYFIVSKSAYQARNPRRTPAATAEPITPATLGPMACISR